MPSPIGRDCRLRESRPLLKDPIQAASMLYKIRLVAFFENLIMGKTVAAFSMRALGRLEKYGLEPETSRRDSKAAAEVRLWCAGKSGRGRGRVEAW